MKNKHCTCEAMGKCVCLHACVCVCMNLNTKMMSVSKITVQLLAYVGVHVIVCKAMHVRMYKSL